MLENVSFVSMQGMPAFSRRSRIIDASMSDAYCRIVTTFSLSYMVVEFGFVANLWNNCVISKRIVFIYRNVMLNAVFYSISVLQHSSFHASNILSTA